jgi:hypothetical protein
MDNQFDTNSVYSVRGEQLNGLDSVMRQLCGLRTPTFQEQRDLAQKLKSILNGVAVTAESRGTPLADDHGAGAAGKPTAHGESLAARVRRAQQRAAKADARQSRNAAGANGDAVRGNRPLLLSKIG